MPARQLRSVSSRITAQNAYACRGRLDLAAIVMARCWFWHLRSGNAGVVERLGAPGCRARNFLRERRRRCLDAPRRHRMDDGIVGRGLGVYILWDRCSAALRTRATRRCAANGATAQIRSSSGFFRAGARGRFFSFAGALRVARSAPVLSPLESPHPPLWIVGFAGERPPIGSCSGSRRPGVRGHTCQSGLWRYSRTRTTSSSGSCGSYALFASASPWG